MLIDRTPVRLRPVDDHAIRPTPADSAYGPDYCRWIDTQVLSASTDRRPRRIPVHAEIGLSGIHHLAVRRAPWWRRLLRRTPWSDVFYVCALIALVVLAIFLSGRSIEIPS